MTNFLGLIAVAMLPACGGLGEPRFTGSWRSSPSAPGSYVVMTLWEPSGENSFFPSIDGKGTEYRASVAATDFTVSGGFSGAPPSVTFNYADQSTEGFSFAQPDTDHLVLSNRKRTLNFDRQ